MANSKIAHYVRETLVSVFEANAAPTAAYLDSLTGGYGFSLLAPVLTSALKVNSAVKNTLEHQGHKAHLAHHDAVIASNDERLGRLESEFLASKTELETLAFDLKDEVEKIAMLVAGFSRSTKNADDLVHYLNKIEQMNKIVIFGEGSICKGTHLEGFQQRPQDYGKVIKPGEPYDFNRIHIITGSESPQLVAMDPGQYAEILQSNKALIPFGLYGNQKQFIAITGPDSREKRDAFSSLTFYHYFTPNAEREPNPEFPWEEEIPQPSTKIAELKSLMESLNEEIQQITMGRHPSQASERLKITEARKAESRARNELTDYPLLSAEIKVSVEEKIRQNPAFRFSSFHVEHPDISDELLVAFTALVQKLIAAESNQKTLMKEYNLSGKEQIGILEGRVKKASAELAIAQRSDLRDVLQKTLGMKVREQYPGDEMAVLLPHLKHRGYTFTKIKLHEEIDEYLDFCKQEMAWTTIADTQNGKQLQAFITNHPKSDRAKEAKALIAKLTTRQKGKLEWESILQNNSRIMNNRSSRRTHINHSKIIDRLSICRSEIEIFQRKYIDSYFENKIATELQSLEEGIEEARKLEILQESTRQKRRFFLILTLCIAFGLVVTLFGLTIWNYPREISKAIKSIGEIISLIICGSLLMQPIIWFIVNIKNNK